MPGWSDLQSTQGKVTKIQAEQVDNRHQFWFQIQGQNSWHYFYLDENKDVAMVQAELLRGALENDRTVQASWEAVNIGGTDYRKTYSVRVL